MIYFLGIESSCDETAAAVFTSSRTILSNVVATQTELHTPFGGVVPEIAARAHLRQLIPTIDLALKKANIELSQLGAVAVNYKPGLAGALLMGVSCARTLALILNIPLIGVNHLEAHIYACRLSAGRDIFPCIGLVVSGGHTALFDCQTPLQMKRIGSTRDDAAGEAFDKIAAVLGLGFPGGPAVEREAEQGDVNAYAFPRSFLKEDRLEFSFSGLKTAVIYSIYGQGKVAGPPPGPGKFRADVAASFQQAVIDVLVTKCQQALKKNKQTRLAVGGGVIANRALRNALQTMTDRNGFELFIPPMNLCTDNAAMAALAIEKWEKNNFSPLDLDIEPNS